MYSRVHGDGVAWMRDSPERSAHAVVTDPPFGKEYEDGEFSKRDGVGGVWRQPPALGGRRRAPMPRFTVLTKRDQGRMCAAFGDFAAAAMRVLVPGGHVFIAVQPLLSHLVYGPMMAAGFEKRGEVVRLVRTLRGGDRPKLAEREFSGVTVMPRSGWEPWGVFRKPMDGSVRDNLRRWGTGGLRRTWDGLEFSDVIESGRTPKAERLVGRHPSLKPQAFLRRLVYASLPLGEGAVIDPFMGSGSTIAAAVAVGYGDRSVGVEVRREFYDVSGEAIPALAAMYPWDAPAARGGVT